MANATIELVPEARYSMNQRRRRSSWPQLFDVLDAVKDPEIPILSIWDLGILQDVSVDAEGVVHVAITPTYSGCPAMTQIRQDIEAALEAAGYEEIVTEQRLTPAWTTDWPGTGRRPVATASSPDRSPPGHGGGREGAPARARLPAPSDRG